MASDPCDGDPEATGRGESIMQYTDIPPQPGAVETRFKLLGDETGLKGGDFVIKKASIADVRDILNLINGYVVSNFLLPRGPQYIFENIRDFVVVAFRDDHTPQATEAARGVTDSPGVIVACGSLHVIWEDLAEVRSLAIHPEFQKRGLGTRMIEFMKQEAKGLGIRRLFAFTLAEEFFRSLGFEPRDREDLPVKVWGECSWCPKFFNCNETGMILEI
jgi:amino-acid N-acetyltransferase